MAKETYPMIDKDPAFPCDPQTNNHGLTKREYIATQIAAAMCFQLYEASDPKHLAKEACRIADALIDELSK